ncbi:MAG TPA: IS4 family transposase [Blastocatellia bacterium]|nr:IS4 family transposase [Blastocatellia bacterium]
MQSITVITLLLQALERVPLQQFFETDPYESRRAALPGARLVKVLTAFQLLSATKLRGLVSAIEDNQSLQRAVGGPVARNTLSNALRQRDPEQMIEAWLELLQTYQPWVRRLGRKFARVALIDASLLKLSLAAFAWAEYRDQTGAAKMHAVLDWACRIPTQLVITAGKLHDVNPAVRVRWERHWTYVQDRGYLSFARLAEIIEAGAHFVVRFKDRINYQIFLRLPLPPTTADRGFSLTSDWAVCLPGWGDAILRLVSYRLPDGRLVRVLTDRFDLSAASVAELYKERWKIENWWRWIKQVFKIKEPLGRSEHALPLQIVGAFITDLLLRAFQQSSGFTSSLYEFVTRCREQSLVPVTRLTRGALREALEKIAKLLTQPIDQPVT